MILVYSSPVFQIFLFLILFICSWNTVNIFDKNTSTIIRYKNKKEYLKNLFWEISIVNFLAYIMYIFSVLIFLILYLYGNVVLGTYTIYNIPMIIYVVFMIIKYFLIVDILILITISIYKLSNIIFGFISLLLILCLKLMWPYHIQIIEDFRDFKLFYGYYLYPFEYSNFAFEISSFFLIFFILLILIFLISLILYKRRKDIICNAK